MRREVHKNHVSWDVLGALAPSVVDRATTACYEVSTLRLLQNSLAGSCMHVYFNWKYNNNLLKYLIHDITWIADIKGILALSTAQFLIYSQCQKGAYSHHKHSTDEFLIRTHCSHMLIRILLFISPYSHFVTRSRANTEVLIRYLYAAVHSLANKNLIRTSTEPTDDHNKKCIIMI